VDIVFKKRRVSGLNKIKSGTALDTATLYSKALAKGDLEGMRDLYSEGYELDFVARDAFQGSELSVGEAADFWESWFLAFPERDYQVTRTIAGEEIIVMQWTFIGTNSGPLMPLIFENAGPPTGKTVRFRGVSVYEIFDGKLARETTYLDLGTLLVELGVTI
jgi:steroid delta-isomerase-like uncharacterized protein